MVNGGHAVFFAAFLAVTGASGLPAGRIENFEMRAPSLHQTERDCRVYLPPSYDRPESARERYPVIVFLHGWPGSEGNWPGQGRVGETLDRLIRARAIPEVIGLFPDGGGSGHLGRSIWLNAANGGSQLETYLVHDLPRWADSTFRTIPEPRMRGVIGLSDGGTGAFNVALRHPSVYGAAASHSGVFRLAPDWSSGPLFSDGAAGDRERAAHSPLLYVASIADSARRVTLLATGSEVVLAVRAREILESDGVGCAVVSMPCWELFAAQDAAYRRTVLGNGVRVGVEAAVRQGWDAWLGTDGGFIGTGKCTGPQSGQVLLLRKNSSGQ